MVFISNFINSVRPSIGRGLGFGLLLFLLPSFAYPAGDTENTGGIWTEVNVAKPLPYNLSIDASLGHRTQDWFRESSRADVGLGLSWKASRNWKISAGYTFIMKHYPTEVSYKNETELEYKYRNLSDATDETEFADYLGLSYVGDNGDTYKYQGYNDKVKNDVRTDKAFWRQRHRIYFDVTYTYKFWKTLRISVRERYQMTYMPKKTIDRTRYREKTVTKYRDLSLDSEGNLNEYTYDNAGKMLTWPYDEVSRYWQEGDVIYMHRVNYDDEEEETSDVTSTYLATHDPLNTTTTYAHEKSAKTRHLLRSRLKLSIDKKGWNWEPYVSVETHNNLGEKWHLDKIRLITGVDYKINRHHEVGIGYVFNHENDDDGNQNIHAISIGYNFKF